MPARAEIDGHGPDAWRVTGVAARDVLYARMGPGTAYPVLTRFSPDERGMRQVTCVPHYTPAHRAAMSRAEFSLVGAGPDAPISDLNLSWWPEGMGAPFYVAGGEGGSVEMTLDALTLAGDPRISGAFVARLCRKQGMFSKPDAEACIDANGSLETILVKE